MADQDFITGPFGSAVPVAQPEVPAPGDVLAGDSTLLQDGPRVPFTDEALAGQQSVGESRARREARANELDSSLLEGIGAAIMTWDTTRLVQRAGRPVFDDDESINQFEYLEHTPLQLSPDEHEYFQKIAVGKKSAEYALGVIEDQRMAHKVAGAHPIAGLATQFIDPLWLAVPPAMKAGTRAPVAGRVVSGVAAGAAGGAVVAMGEGAVSDKEIALNMILGAGAGAVFYQPGKGLLNKHPDFPAGEVAHRIAGAVGDTERAAVQYRLAEEGVDAGRAVIPLVKRERDEEVDVPPVDPASAPRKVELIHRPTTLEQLPGKHTYKKFIDGVANSADPVLSRAAKQLLESADPKLWDMPVRLSGNARAYVSHQGFAVLRKDSSPFTIVHEAVHVATIRPIQTFLDGNAAQLGKQTRRGVEELNRLFTDLRAEWELETGKKAGRDAFEHTEYAFKDLHEFTAQAASSETFQRWLANKPGGKGTSAWRQFITAVADILGIKKTGSKLDEVLDALDTLLTARDTHYYDRSGKKVAYSPDYNIPMPFMHEFSNVFTEEAINNAKRYARRAGAEDSKKGRVVMMSIDDFLGLAYPRSRTQRDLTEAQRIALAEEKRGPIRAAINKGGLDEVPFLTLEGNKVVGHEGRHRADVLREQFFDEIPVVLKGNNIPPAGSRIISETGDNFIDLPETILEDAQVRPAMTPEALRPGAVNHDPKVVVDAVDTQLARESKRRGLGTKLMWNMHKTMGQFGTAGKKIADLLYDNNADLSRTSIESHREAILSDLRRHQFEYEDALRQQMAAEGFGTLKMLNPMTSRQAYAKQAEIERQVMRELLRREQIGRDGGVPDFEGVPKHIKEMADKLDVFHKSALAEMKRAGVEGAESIKDTSGYLTRRWSSTSVDDLQQKFQSLGLDPQTARGKIVELVALSVRRANQIEPKVAKQIASAIIDRAMRRGYFEDSAFHPTTGAGELAELRDALNGAGMAAKDVERIMDSMRGKSDEQGKAGFMKHRMDLDYNASVRVWDEVVSITDLLDSRVTNLVDTYSQRVATNVAFARMGMPKRSDVDNLRAELLENTPVAKREQAKDLFDNTIAHYRGEPAGGKMAEQFRLYQTYGRSIALAWSGLWQMTEYATAMAEFGLAKSLKYAVQEMPGFKQLLGSADKAEARSLQNVLADHSVQSLRLRPYLARFEDGYEMNTGSALQLSAQPVGQLVPYANAMKFVHHHQARMVGNLILDRLEMAANGNVKARAALQKYGLEAPVMDKLAAEIAAKGFDVDKWDDAVWAAVRPSFAKMMDASVLKSRLGDTPAFVAFDPVGKFIFSYRTFVLTAHNKIVAGTLARDGSAALGLILLYQFPLAMAAVQARAAVMGEGQLSQEELVKKAVGQMGGLGLFSEPFKWASGESNSWGASGLIPVDRSIKLFQSAAQLDAEKGASTALTMLPVVSAVPFMRGMSEHIKE